MLKSTAVEITTFVNPHLFWFFEIKDQWERTNFEQYLKDNLGSLSLEKNLHVGQEVVIYDDLVWKRGLVKTTSNGCTVWLIDYGVVCANKKIYTLPDGFKQHTAFVKQGALNDVVNTKHEFIESKIETTITEEFCCGTIKKARDRITRAKSVFFDCLIEKDNVHLGEISYLDSDNKLHHLTKVLIEEGHLIYNKDTFSNVLEINRKVNDWDVVFKVKSATPCSSMNLKNESNVLSEVRDIIDITALGRGKSRNKLDLSKKTNGTYNRSYVENWLVASNKMRKSNECFGTDEDTFNSEMEGNSLNDTTTSGFDSSRSFEDVPMKELNSSYLDKSNCSTEDGILNSSFTEDKFIAKIRRSLESKQSKKSNVSSASLSTTDDKSEKKWEFVKSATKQKMCEQLNLIPAGMSPVCPSNKLKPQFSNVQKSAENRKSTEWKDIHNEKLEFSTSVKLDNATEENSTLTLKGCCLPGCKCPDCFIYTTESLDFNENAFINTNDTKVTKDSMPIKPLPLLKKEDNLNAIEMDSHTFVTSLMSSTERAKAPRLLAHGHSLPYPVGSPLETPFHKDVHRVLNPFKVAFTLQSYAWPCLMRNIPVCLINAAKSGKTMSYLPAICSYLLDRHERYENLSTKTISPLAIIICPGSTSAENIFIMIKKLVEFSRNKPEIILALPPLDKQCLHNLQKEFDVLITTPLSLLSLLKSRIITVKRVCHLVIEDGDVVLERFSKEIDSLLKLMNNMLEHRNCSHSIQMVVCAKHWTQRLENMLKALYITPAVCIASHLEAALYGRADMKMHFLHSKQKMSTLSDILKDSTKYNKTLVICNNYSEVDETKEYLRLAGVDAFFVQENTAKEEVLEFEVKWLHASPNKKLVMICTNQTYNCLVTISNAVQLIHYSLPDTWTDFSNRFSCLLDNYASPLTANKPVGWLPVKVHIFVDESSNTEYPKLIQLLLRLRVQLSPAFKECFKEAVKAREEEKVISGTPLCKRVKLFGYCLSDNRQLLLRNTSVDFKSAYSVLDCSKRHKLSFKVDYTSDLPKCGLIKFQFINVKDVTSFNMKILEYSNDCGKMAKWNNDDNLNEQLQKAMAAQTVKSFEVKLNELYALRMQNKKYYRCRILKILHYQVHTKLADSVCVRLLDVGTELDISTEDIYELPEYLKKIRPQAVQVHLANMVPPDLDDNWGTNAINKVKHIIRKADCNKVGVFAMGKILLSLNDELWVRNLMFYENLSTLDVNVNMLNLRNALETENMISLSSEQLNGLYGLCKEARIDLPDYDNVKVPIKELKVQPEIQIQPQWAFLEKDIWNEIYIICGISPTLLYVHLKKFYNLLLSFEDEVQKLIAKPFYPTDFTVEVGKYYLGKDTETKKYSRLKVVEIIDDLARCLFVDYGDEACIPISEIKYLSNELIAKLPFQAIECRLYGVQPVWDDWEDTATDVICNYIFKPDTDYFRTLYTSVCKYETAEKSDRKKCAILLVDNFQEDKIVLINKLLIDCGEALALPNEDLLDDLCILNDQEEFRENIMDSDEEIKDKDLTMEDIQRYSKQFNTVTNASMYEDDKNNETKDTDSEASGSTHSWDFEVFNPDEFLKGFLGLSTSTLSTENKTNEYNLPFMRALPNPEYSTPDVKWYQTGMYIKMSIILPNVDNYKLQLSRQRLLVFRANYNHTDYCLDLALYEKVQNTLQHSSCGSYIKVTLTKFTAIEWPRLLLSPQKMRHIKYDLEQYNIPEEKKKLIAIDIKDEVETKEDGFVFDIDSDDADESDVDCDYVD